VEEVRRYKYLGYVFQSNGKQEEQVRDRVKRGMAVMGQVWGIGKRKFEKNGVRKFGCLTGWYGR